MASPPLPMPHKLVGASLSPLRFAIPVLVCAPTAWPDAISLAPRLWDPLWGCKWATQGLSYSFECLESSAHARCSSGTLICWAFWSSPSTCASAAAHAQRLRSLQPRQQAPSMQEMLRAPNLSLLSTLVQAIPVKVLQWRLLSTIDPRTERWPCGKTVLLAGDRRSVRLVTLMNSVTNSLPLAVVRLADSEKSPCCRRTSL
mmetsp:Transcript_55460/g.102598  ORF Transcript_55460/g.102598 Transcript_55460/m.102598 type:complete len:201 (+) Transcript_55460:550-1152(+)